MVDTRDGAVGRWVEESCRIVATDGFYPTAHKIDDVYAKRWGGTVVQRMAAAAQRLASALNQGLSAR
jgi:hypothetical protein